MSRKLRLHRETLRELTRPDAASAVGGMVPPAVLWTPVIPATVSHLIQASIQMCTAWGLCVSDNCGPDTSPVTACACLPSDAPGYC